MPRFSREPLDKLVSLRLTQEQDQLLGELVQSLGIVGGKAELVRRALDYWMDNAPEAREAIKKEAHKGKG